MSKHKVFVNEDQIFVHKILSDGLPAQMPTMILSFDEALDLGRQLMVDALVNRVANGVDLEDYYDHGEENDNTD